MAEPQAKELLVVSLGTPIAEANAAAVASVMQAIVAIVEEAQKEFGEGESLILKARPLKGGSLEIPLDLVVIGIQFAPTIHPVVDYILRVIGEYLKLKRDAKGKPIPVEAATGNSVTFNGDVTMNNPTFNIFVNDHVNESFDKAANEIEKDESIKSLKFVNPETKKSIAEFSRGELKYLKHDSNQSPVEGFTRTRTIDDALLVIHSTVFQGNGQWTFIYEGKQVKAKIQDESFMRRVAERIEIFAAGDRLRVRLTIQEEYKPSLATYEIKKHTVTEVLDHKPPIDDRPLLEAE